MANYTKSQLRVLKAGNATFIALKAANPDYWYDTTGGHLMTLRYSNGSVLQNVRPDSAAVMRAIITYMGYDMQGSRIEDWFGHTTNDIIKDKNGGYSQDWLVGNFSAADRKPGDILITSDKANMFVYLDSSNRPRGFSAGSGYQGSVIGNDIAYSVNLAEHFVATGEWDTGSATDGAFTITDSQTPITRIRYIGAGSEPATTGYTFTTAQTIYDVSVSQRGIFSDIDALNPGGVMIHVCNIRSYGVGKETTDRNVVPTFREAVQHFSSITPMGFYFYSQISYSESEANAKDCFRQCLQTMESAGITPDNARLGVWLKVDSNSPTPSTPETNINLLNWFREVLAESGYGTRGIYAPVPYISSPTQTEGGNFSDADMQDIPIWAYWVGHTVGEASTWATLHSYTALTLLLNVEAQIASVDTGEVHQIKATEYGENDYTKPETGTSDTGVGVYSIVPANRILFNPTPGKIARGTVVSVDTDAANAKVYVTLDNSVPDYSKASQNWTGKRYIFNRDYHLRAYAFDSTGTVVAKGSATYTIAWERPRGEYLDEVINEIRTATRTSLQPHLQYHPTAAIAEVATYTEQADIED